MGPSRRLSPHERVTDEVDQARMQMYKQPLAVAEPPTMAEAPRRASTFNLLGMCLNWKVLAGLAVVGLLVLVVAPQFIGVALPLLLVAACPLSMLFMMRGMSGNGNANQTASQTTQLPAGGSTREEQLAELQSRLSSVQAEKAAIARHIAEIESPEVLTSPGWGAAVDQGRWPGQVRPFTKNRRHVMFERIL